jgi:hypothetical protein
MEGKPIYQSKYANSWALIIGINKYQYASPLGYATNDAQSIAEVLEKRFNFPKENISLLLDETATAEGIRKSFLEYTKDGKVGPDDRILVFYAGHGHTLKGKRGEVGFLVPVDGKPDEMETLMRWDDLTRNADLVPAKHIFFLMDACYGGLAFLRSPAFGNMRFLGDMLQRYSRQVLTAGKADETVADGNGIRPGHSIFTAHLLDALEGSAATQEGIITANGVMAYVYDRVARDQYSHQTPHYGFIEGDGDFIFDTSLLEKVRDDAIETEGELEEGEKDILVNTSPQIAIEGKVENPLVETMKELLSEPSNKIKLDDFVSMYIRRFLDATDLRHFPVEGSNIKKEDFIDRLNKYEELSKDLQQIVILISKWGNKDQLLLLEKIFTRLAEADKGSSGSTLWIHFGWYPIQILIYSAGITALATKNYEALKIVLLTQVETNTTSDNQLPIVVPVGTNMANIHDTFKLLPGHEKQYVPRSEHLLKALQPILEDLLFLGRSYEPLFDAFEVMFALTYADVSGRDWGPAGRFGWKHSRGYGDSPFTSLIEIAKKEGDKWGPIKAGMFQGSITRFKEITDKYSEILKKLSWW